MKILRIIARLNVGGPARHVVWLTKALNDDEYQSVLISGTVPAGEEDMSYFARVNGVEPIYIEEMSRELSPKDIISLFKVYRRIQFEKPDLIHTHTAKAGTIGRIAAWMYRWGTWRTLIGRPRVVRVVHTFHGHVFHSYYGRFKTRIFINIERLLARVATNKIVVISAQQKKEISQTFGIGREGQYATIPLGIDLEPFRRDDSVRASVRNELGIVEDDVIVGFVGRLTEIKNLPLLLRVVATYKRESKGNRPQMRFVIAGDGHCRHELELMARNLGINSLLQFIGNRADIASVYAALDIVALTSNNEGTPLSLIEGMAAGKAVISTGVGGVVDLLGGVQSDNGGFKVCDRGIRIDSRDEVDYYNGLNWLTENNGLRQEMATRGKQFVDMHYTKQRLEADIRSLYKGLLLSK